MMQLLRRILPIGLAVSLLVYALKDISWSLIGQQFQRAHYGRIALVGLLTVLAYGVRGKRWQQPLLALGYHPTTLRSTVAILAGTIASLVVPGAGELTRCATLQRTDGVPLAQGVGSVVAERLLDLFMLGWLLLIAFLLEFGRMSNYMAELQITAPSWPVVLFGIVFLTALGIAICWGCAYRRIWLEYPPMTRLVAGINEIRKGAGSLQNLPNSNLFVLLTVLNQVFAWVITYGLLLSLERTQHLPPSAALTILAVSSLGGLAVPTQGGIGTYHFLVGRALVLYGFTPVDGTVIATFLHAIGLGVNLLLSSLSFLLLPFLVVTKTR